MVPVFGDDEPALGEGGDGEGGEGDRNGEEGEGEADRERESVKVRVGYRMPYDLPLLPYTEDETPWSAEIPCREPDKFGRAWIGYGA